MCVNIGHGDARVVKAIAGSGGGACYVNPFMATEPRARLGAKLADDRARRHRRVLLHERRRRSQRERDQDRARRDRPAEDPRALPLVSRRHGRRDFRDRRSAALGRARDAGRRFTSLNPYHGIQRGWDSAEQALAIPRRGRSSSKGPQTIAAFILETVVGTNGVLIPPDGYLAGRARALRQVRHSADLPTK